MSSNRYSWWRESIGYALTVGIGLPSLIQALRSDKATMFDPIILQWVFGIIATTCFTMLLILSLHRIRAVIKTPKQRSFMRLYRDIVWIRNSLIKLADLGSVSPDGRDYIEGCMANEKTKLIVQELSRLGIYLHDHRSTNMSENFIRLSSLSKSGNLTEARNRFQE